ELFNALIFPVCDVDVAAALNGNADRVVELTVPGAGDCATTAGGARASEADASVIDDVAVDAAVAATQPADEGADAGKFLDPIIKAVGDGDVISGVNGDARVGQELIVAGALRAPL